MNDDSTLKNSNLTSMDRYSSSSEWGWHLKRIKNYWGKV